MVSSTDKLRVFLSWSGVRSKLAAEAVRGWLPLVLQNVSPYFTPEDIDKGARWNGEIRDELVKSDFGIIFLTPENQHSPWILFEAGSLSKLETSRVAPLLLGLDATDVSGPLSQMQLTTDSKADFLKLVKAINSGLGGLSLDVVRLEKIFNALWPEREDQLKAAKAASILVPKPSRRSDRELLEEIVERVRAIEVERSVGLDIVDPRARRFSRELNHKLPPTLDLKIKDLPISERAVQVLNMHGVFSLQDLVKYSKDDLLHVPNLGRKAASEVVVALQSVGFFVE